MLKETIMEIINIKMLGTETLNYPWISKLKQKTWNVSQKILVFFVVQYKLRWLISCILNLKGWFIMAKFMNTLKNEKEGLVNEFTAGKINTTKVKAFFNDVAEKKKNK